MKVEKINLQFKNKCHLIILSLVHIHKLHVKQKDCGDLTSSNINNNVQFMNEYFVYIEFATTNMLIIASHLISSL